MKTGIEEFSELGFRFEISTVEEWEMDNGNDAYVMFVKISNDDPTARLINASKATYVTVGGEQLEQDLWVNGYLKESGRIMGGSHRKCGLVFYEDHLPSMLTGDSIFVGFVIPDRAKKITMKFNRMEKSPDGNVVWTLSEAQLGDVDADVSPRVLRQKLNKKIERLEAFEERLGVRLEGLCVKLHSDEYFFINGELHPRDGVKLNQDTQLVAAIYDSDGGVLETCSHTFWGSSKFSVGIFIEGPGRG